MKDASESKRRGRSGQFGRVAAQESLEANRYQTHEHPLPPIPLQYSGSKRTSGSFEIPSTRLQKRPRLDPFPENLSLEDLQASTGPLSPLFFSNHVHQRPAFPPRFSSSEAGAKMLSRAKGEDSNIRTVKLARGSYITNAGPTSMPQIRRHGSSDRGQASRRPSSEQSDRVDQAQLLRQIGMTEFLDHDDRPSFIVDLMDSANSDSNTLSLVYANSALLSCGALIDQIQGKAPLISPNSSTSNTFHAFRQWVLGSSFNARIYGASQSVYHQSSMSWVSSTLRNRFRVISGVALTEESRRASSNTFSSTFTTFPEEVQTPSTRKGSLEEHSEPLVSRRLSRDPDVKDYFSNTSNSIKPQSSPSARFHLRNAESSPSPKSGTPGVPYEHPLKKDVVSPIYDPAYSLEATSSSSEDSNSSANDAAIDSVGFFDWTRLPNDENLPEHIRFARSVDWSSTSLGPIELWSPDLRQMVCSSARLIAHADDFR